MNNLWENLTVKRNLIFYCQIKGLDLKSIEILLNYLELNHYYEMKVKHLSSGNKRKLCVLISLLNKPKFLIYDEATSGLDI